MGSTDRKTLILVGLAAVAVVAVFAFTVGGSAYTVKARFVSASQIVEGNAVRVSGQSIGSVDDIRLTDDGQAELTLKISEDGYFRCVAARGR